MGMAASQARYLGLTARKTNVEYEGQQINQARTALANQSANTFNDLLALEVPTAPSTQDFTELKYTYKDGTQAEEISEMTELQNDPDGYNYLITHFHFADIYRGVQNKLSNPQVVQDDVPTKDAVSRDEIDTVEQPTFTVNGFNVTTYDPADANQKNAFDELFAQYPDMDANDMMTYTDANGNLHFVSKTELKGTGSVKDRYVQAGKPSEATVQRGNVVTSGLPGNQTYTVNGFNVNAYDANDADQKAAFDRLSAQYPDITANDAMTYTDADGKIHFVSKNELQGAGDIKDRFIDPNTNTIVDGSVTRGDIVKTDPTGNLTYTVNGNKVSKYDPTNLEQKKVYDKLLEDYPSLSKDIDDLGCYTDEQGRIHFTSLSGLADKNSGDLSDYYVESSVPTYVGNCKLEKYDPADPDLKTAYEQILKDWPDSNIALAKPDEIYTWEYQGETRFACIKDLTSSAISGPDQSLPTENQDKLTYYVAKNVKEKIEITEKAMVDLDENGRPQTIRYQDSSVTYYLNTETQTDEDAYQDAMNQYNYDMQVYEKKIQDINAKTEKIQQQDRTLELRLRQLDTEQEALQTEMEAVKKVIDKNIESTFKTFE
ncbi:MAG: hypothetical protein KH301_07125 [Brachyspira sp.]|nr:hypothetical protein [Brachyspira sp.]